jgi:hypothetical protein
MDEISKEIEAMAEKLSKSVEDPKETLFKTIAALGKEGIKARMGSLSADEKTLLKAALEEMTLKKAKSVELDKEARGAHVIQGNIMDTVIQEEIGSDDADEKLVKPEAAKHSHQGNSVEGWEGQVVKSACAKCGAGMQGLEKCGKCGGSMKKGESVPKKSMKQEEQEDAEAASKVGIYAEKKGKAMKKSTVELVEQMNKSEDILVKAIERMHEKGMRKKMIKKNLESVGVDNEKVKNAMGKMKMKKAMAKEEAAKKIMAMEEKEHGTKDPKKLVEAEKKEDAAKKMKKSEEDAKHILKEEDQSNDTAQMTEESKDLGVHIDTAKDNKRAQAEVNNMKVEGMKKGFDWTPENALLKANTNGRNFHFNVGDFVETMLKADEEAKKMKKEGKEPKEEGEEKEPKEMKMKKSEDINDLIEKSLDTTWFAEDMKKSLAAQDGQRSASLVKSFNEVEDMATLLGISPEEAKKILG